jgi:hypothetical protein
VAVASSDDLGVLAGHEAVAGEDEVSALASDGGRGVVEEVGVLGDATNADLDEAEGCARAGGA